MNVTENKSIHFKTTQREHNINEEKIMRERESATEERMQD